MNELLRDYLAKTNSKHCGTTLVLLVSDRIQKKIHCLNVGDARAILCSEGQVMRLSFDHKPILEEEDLKIREKGGFVANGRVNGTLGVSRSLGDFYLGATISAEPFVKTIPFPQKNSVVVMGCDGLFDELSDEEVLAFTKVHTRAEALRDAAFLLGSDDNISCFVLTFSTSAKIKDEQEDEEDDNP